MYAKCYTIFLRQCLFVFITAEEVSNDRLQLFCSTAPFLGGEFLKIGCLEKV